MRSLRSAITTEVLCSIQSQGGGQEITLLYSADSTSGTGVLIVGQEPSMANSCVAKFSGAVLSSDTIIEVAPGVDAALVVAIFMASIKLEARFAAQKSGMILGGARNVRF